MDEKGKNKIYSEDLYKRLSNENCLIDSDINHFSGNINSITDMENFLVDNKDLNYILINLSKIKNFESKLPDILKVFSKYNNSFVFLISDLSKINAEDIKSLINLEIKIKSIYYWYCTSDKYIKSDPKDFYNMIYIIDQMVKLVEQNELSPYERLIYAYDMVKVYKYKKLKNEVDWTISRAPHEVLKSSNNYIVCAAYAEILNILLNKNNISSEVIISKIIINNEQTDRHALNIFRLIDAKYNINGIYTADATQDSVCYINGKKL